MPILDNRLLDFPLGAILAFVGSRNFISDRYLAASSRRSFICAKAKRQRQMFYLCESEATATNVLSVRKRSGSNKAPSRSGNQPYAMILSQIKIEANYAKE